VLLAPIKEQAMPPNHPTGRFRERSLLLNPAPVIGAALAAFAIAFGGLTLRLATGHDPAVSLSATAGRSNGASATALRTTASGRVLGAGGGASPTASKANGSSIVTTTSGVRAGAGRSPRGVEDA
jgi:hypothetical protein